ncbi:MAG: RdgB/HAM1 family non-canonical purine NTP pyrophosphatase [Candidatus Zipacnadales bacterium]
MRGSATRLVVLSTGNPSKARELERLCNGLPVRFTLLREIVGEADLPEPFTTFRENALYKACITARLSNEWALGEDSGLAVDALGGRPGVYSARFAGSERTDDERIALLLRMLDGVPPNRRTARFRCAIALAAPDGILGQWEGVCEGTVADAPRGQRGFGYDPIFFARGQARTNAELTLDEKNAISHRGMAIRQLVAELPRLLGR